MEQESKLNQRSTSAKNRNLSCRAESRPRIQVVAIDSNRSRAVG
jgi:hypothetical protein